MNPFDLVDGLPSSITFQVALAGICDHHQADLKLFDEVNQLIQQYPIGRHLSFSADNLTNRISSVKILGKNLKTQTLK
jgi:hypothetical protein